MTVWDLKSKSLFSFFEFENSRGAKMTENWVKQEDAIFKFENVGDMIEGQYIAKETGKTYGNEVYKIKIANGEMMAVFSTTVLATKMATIPLGSFIRIVYTAETPNKNTKLSSIKQFDIYKKN